MTGKLRRAQSVHHISGQMPRRGFTLIELLIVVGIIGILMSALGVTISNMLESAKEARTLSTIQKVEGLINERRKGMERSFARPSFQVLVKRKAQVLATQFPGLSEKAVAILLKKDMARLHFPQTFSEYMLSVEILKDVTNHTIDFDGTGVPDILEQSGLDLSKHDLTTESAEMLFVVLTKLEAFGVQTAGEDSFTTDEVRDTDGDGLPEIVDGWGNPLRFYRSPTSILKPFGIAGRDQEPGDAGVDDDGIDGNDDTVGEYATPNTDDTVIEPEARTFASFLMSGLPRPPQVQGQYDVLNEDPDDPYGLLLAEMKRLSLIPNLSSPSDYLFDKTDFEHFETLYHSFDTFHKPLVVSAGPDGLLGLHEPFTSEDLNYNKVLDAGEDLNGDGVLNDGFSANCLGWQRAVPIDPDPTNPLNFSELTSITVAFDNMTNRNRRAGGQ